MTIDEVGRARVQLPANPAYQALAGRVDAVVFLTCEHASEHFEPPWALSGLDARLAGTHWAYDAGAEQLTRELAAALDAPAVLAKFSRLIIDPNRELTAPTLFRATADHLPVHLNLEVTAADRAARIARFWQPYHRAIDQGLTQCSAPLVFPVHTFTQSYQGNHRPMQLGVLFSQEEALAAVLTKQLRSAGFEVAMNEPWSGKDGLMYCGERHANAHNRKALELEARQDCATDPSFRARLVPVLTKFLREHAQSGG